MSFETQEIERKIVYILRILSESAEPLGARLVSRQLQDSKGTEGIQALISQLYIPNSLIHRT